MRHIPLELLIGASPARTCEIILQCDIHYRPMCLSAHWHSHPACQNKVTAVGFEPTPLRNGALSHRLRPLGQTVLKTWEFETADAPLTNCGSRFCNVLQNERAHPDLSQGPADLQSAALTTDLCTQLHSVTRPSPLQAYLQRARYMLLPVQCTDP